MRIVYLANSAWPRIRGAERLMLGLVAHGRSRGDEVCVIAPAESAIHEACAERGFRSEPARFGVSLSHTARLRSLLAVLRPDVVHGMSIFPVAYIRSLGLLPEAEATACFADVSIDPTSALPVAAGGVKRVGLAVRNAVSRAEAPRLDAIFTRSRQVAEGLERARIHGRVLVNSGVLDVCQLEADAGAADALEVLELPQGSPKIGYAGFFERLKGIDVLIAAFARVAPAHPEAQLLLAGDGPERDALVAQAQSLGVVDRVHFLGFVDPVAPLLASLDIFVSPSRSEALGRSILESMALGVPVVCTRSGGPDGYLEDGVSGLLVPVDDAEGIAACIEALIADPERALRIAEAGRAVARGSEHLLSTAFGSVYAEYERAVAARRKQGS